MLTSVGTASTRKRVRRKRTVGPRRRIPVLEEGKFAVRRQSSRYPRNRADKNRIASLVKFSVKPRRLNET